MNKKGCLIILTCAHNIVSISHMNRRRAELYQNLVAYRARQGFGNYYEKYKVVKAVYHPNYAQQKSSFSGFDIGLCFVERVSGPSVKELGRVFPNLDKPDLDCKQFFVTQE